MIFVFSYQCTSSTRSIIIETWSCVNLMPGSLVYWFSHWFTGWGSLIQTQCSLVYAILESLVSSLHSYLPLSTRHVFEISSAILHEILAFIVHIAYWLFKNTLGFEVVSGKKYRFNCSLLSFKEFDRVQSPNTLTAVQPCLGLCCFQKLLPVEPLFILFEEILAWSFPHWTKESFCLLFSLLSH